MSLNPERTRKGESLEILLECEVHENGVNADRCSDSRSSGGNGRLPGHLLCIFLPFLLLPKYVPSKLQCGASPFHLPCPGARVLALRRKSRPRVPRSSTNDEVPQPDDDPDVRISGGSVAPSGEGAAGAVDLGWFSCFPARSDGVNGQFLVRIPYWASSVIEVSRAIWVANSFSLLKRRSTLCSQAAAMFLIVFAVDFPVNDHLSHTLSILGTVMYMFTFSLGAGPVTGLIIPELSSNRTRGKTMAFSFSVHWVCNFIVGLFFLDLVEKFGIGPVCASFGAVSVAAALFAKVFIIETKGRSLEEIELSLKANISSRDE